MTNNFIPSNQVNRVSYPLSTITNDAASYLLNLSSNPPSNYKNTDDFSRDQELIIITGRIFSSRPQLLKHDSV